MKKMNENDEVTKIRDDYTALIHVNIKQEKGNYIIDVLVIIIQCIPCDVKTVFV